MTRVVAGVLVASIAIVLVTGLVQLRLVASESMSGTFEKDDMVIVVSPQLADVALGSIIVFHYYNLDRTEMIGDFSHRIVGGAADEGWLTQGDANPDPDLSPVLSQDIIGVVVGWVPGIGVVLRPQIVLGVMVLLFMAVILGPEIRDALKGRRR
jgi:signal peptidase I